MSANARRVTITLSAAQRDHVVLAAAGAGNLEGMPTHRYLSTPVVAGLVEQDPESRRYGWVDASHPVGGWR